MESFEDSHCTSMSIGFSLYERYMRSFNVVDNFELSHQEASEPFNCEYESSNSAENINLSPADQTDFCKHRNLELNRAGCSSIHPLGDCDDKGLEGDLRKVESPSTSLAASLLESLSATDHCINEKSELTDIQPFSEESISRDSKPVFITATMENSNNAVDSVPMFRDVKQTENVFKLPLSELTFNASILKHVQKLTPIVDPITALSTSSNVLNLNEDGTNMSASNDTAQSTGLNSSDSDERSRTSTNEKVSESSDNSYYQEFNLRKESNEGNSRWNAEQSFSSLEGSFDSGVRSPDMFSDGDEDKEPNPAPEPFWDFIKTYEKCDKRKVRKIEETLQGILPPPSITTLKTDVTQLLKKYYSFLPIFNGEETMNMETNSITPTKKVSFIKIPITNNNCEASSSKNNSMKMCLDPADNSNPEYDPNNSLNDKSIEIKMSSKSEVLQTSWPDILKCKYYDVHYNVTAHSEKLERLMQKYAERFVGAETDTSVNIHSGGLQSPSSASKRKALRLRMAQAKSPGRRLSHLARRRQAFCSAATISEKAQCSTSKMVLIDKKKLVNSSERKSPRLRRTPGKKTPTNKTPGKKTPGKKTPAKTPKANGGSSRKKAMRRLLMDTEALSKSQPTRESLKRALFVSPENRKTVPIPTCSSVPHQAMKSKRALFGSPVRAEETKSLDGTLSDQFLKRKRDVFEDEPQTSRSKIAKSLSFGGDRISSTQPVTLNRRASEMLSTKTMAELNETHKKKLLWAVTEALRLHGWRMSSPGFREKASALARLTRRLLTLPPHAARLAAPQLSTSDTMFKLARQYVFAIIQGRTVDECFQDEQVKLSNDTNKISGYISASAYQQLKTKQVPFTSKIKENTCTSQIKTDQLRSGTKNILQDKMVNIDSNSNSSSGFGTLEKAGVFKSNSMPSFEEAAKMRARRQISFDNMDFPKR